MPVIVQSIPTVHAFHHQGRRIAVAGAPAVPLVNPPPLWVGWKVCALAGITLWGIAFLRLYLTWQELDTNRQEL